jgi:hypothetical protein
LKPEGWGSSLVQEKSQEEKDCAKRHPYLTIKTEFNPRMPKVLAKLTRKLEQNNYNTNYTTTKT